MAVVPQPTFGPNGFIIPQEAEILAANKANINTAFGGDLNMADETPQGQLASSMTALAGFINDMFLNYSQQLDPAYADGRNQDALARIYFIERTGAEPTTVDVICSGLVGTVIPAGSIATTADGTLYTATDGGTIGAGGTVTLAFACNTLGPVACPIGTVTEIYRAIPGWDSVNNAVEGVLGRNTETRAEFEERRFASVANNANGFLPAVQGAVLGVANVLDAYVTENFTAAPLVVGGVTLAAHSLYVAVSGGDNDDVAKAIWTKKAPGCNYNGTTTVTVYDDINYSLPYPSYDVSFTRPSSLPFLIKVSIVDSTQVPADALTQIQDAIISAFAGNDGGARARIGSKTYSSRYYGPVAALGAWAQVVSILMGSQNTDAAEFTASIAAAVMTVTAVASGTLAVGQNVIGEGVLAGTTIASLGTGVGGTGTYNLNLPQTVASETMYGVLADQNSVTARIDQVPTISADDITVVLV